MWLKGKNHLLLSFHGIGDEGSCFKGVSKELKKSFNSAIEEVVEAGTKKKLTKNEKELQKLQKIINMQERKITELQSSAEENKRKGELIYEKYQLLTKVLEDIIKARKTHSWREIKERTKGHVLIKEVNENILNALIDQSLTHQEAQKYRIEVSENEIDKSMEKMLRSYG